MRGRFSSVVWSLAALVFGLFFAQLVFFKLGRGSRAHEAIYVGVTLLYAIGFVACAKAAHHSSLSAKKPHAARRAAVTSR